MHAKKRGDTWDDMNQQQRRLVTTKATRVRCWISWNVCVVFLEQDPLRPVVAAKKDKISRRCLTDQLPPRANS